METSEEDPKMNLHNNQDHLKHQDHHSSSNNPTNINNNNNNNDKNKGGFITIPFIIANESFEKVASYGLIPNMIIYLMKDYKMSVTKAQNLLYFWNAALNFLPIVGAFVADSYLGRFLTIGIGSIITLLGMIIMWMTTVLPNIKPPPCNPLVPNNACQSPTAGQYAFLILAFILMSIGAGGIRPCSQAFGADQVHQRENPKNKRVLETFFNWYYACICLSVVIALTVVVYIQDHFGWRIGFGVPVILMFLSAVSFFLASRWYLTMKVQKSLFTSLTQVIVAAFRNRKTILSIQGSNVQYYQPKDSILSNPSDKLRFFNKACIIQDPDDITPEGLPRNPWRLCAVDDVEGLKSLLRVMPVWSSTIMMSVTVSVGSFPVLLAMTMDRHLGSKFEIPAASFSTFLVVVIVIWIPIYDRVLLPLASKICGRPVRFGVKLRMGIGLFSSFMAMVSAGTVETIRRQKAIAEGFENNPLGVLQMSAMWTIPQYIFGGLAEAFNGIGQTEFYYSELPKNMSSIATCLNGVGMAFGSLIASLILNVVNGITKKHGKEGWIASNVNQGHYDYYYWLLAILSFLNLFYYMYCSWAYGPLIEQRKKVVPRETKEEELAMLRNTSRHEKGDLLQDNFKVLK